MTDTVTGLMWIKDANPFGRLMWQDAISRCSSFSISGIGGRGLPSKDELVVLYHAIQGGHLFNGVQSSPYWSSTPYAANAPWAWYVRMDYGNMYYDSKTLNFYLWPVRAAQ